jgi:hypothetical protein
MLFEMNLELFGVDAKFTTKAAEDWMTDVLTIKEIAILDT